MLTRPVYAPITIGAWAVCSLIASILNKNKFVLKWEFIFVIVLYLLYALGVFWSDNKEVAYFDLEMKMALVILPVFYAYVRYDKRQVKIVLRCFIYGLIFGLSLLYISAFYDTVVAGEIKVGRFLYNSFSTIIHPAYFAFYICTAILLLILDCKYKRIDLFKSNWTYAIIIAFLVVSTICMLSKVGLFMCIGLMSLQIFFWIKSRKWLYALSFVVGIVVLFSTVYYSSERVRTRIDEMTDSLYVPANSNNENSSNLRVVIWDISVELLSYYPWYGLGPGDVKQRLVVEYRIRGLKKAETIRLNAHNQFLQSGLSVGVGAIITMALFVLIPIFRIRQNFGYGALFSILTITFMLTEATLETQAGVLSFVVFFVIFNSFDQTMAKPDEDLTTNIKF